ncbi:hypothetical protein [Paraburkholderia tropica]|uniref:hypothetical protein n=1 Tax=Paraburkholderia tropica TaxID=92647 RepID=UPI003D26EA5A
MKFWTIRQWQAHILVAALAALAIQGMVFIGVLILGAPIERFDNPTFHLAAAVSIVLIALLVRTMAHAAFRHAASRGFLRDASHAPGMEWMSHDCPHRVLVSLHCLLRAETRRCTRRIRRPSRCAPLFRPEVLTSLRHHLHRHYVRAWPRAGRHSTYENAVLAGSVE